MQFDELIHRVCDQLATSAALGDEGTQQIAATLATTVEPAVRLAIMDALADAADEITAALLDVPGGPVVAVRLDGDQLRVDVTRGQPQAAARSADDGDASARISLRLSEALKADLEAAAGRDGLSVNSWLVRAATDALAAGSGSLSWGRSGPGGRSHNSQRITGWVNG
ncbi:MAG: toxin-antitoxin system HicB family antitoxin [Solirubrobacteraceae bacterium]|nr:MAG: toxin-antitoxin system HicB family antitoxin [Solirubrobacterales bacterium]